MITLTIEQLVMMFNAPPNSGQLSPIQRFFSCGLSLPAWKSLRHTAAACEQEIVVFNKKRDELSAKYKGEVVPGGQGIKFPDEASAQKFAAEWAELMKTEVTIVGDPIKVDDIQNGFLAPNDYRSLKPFFTD
jgi:hypothetical protein